jgi:glycosyltransferase involved in cell wall biosynthesis
MTATFSIVVPVYQNEKNLPTTVPTLLDIGARAKDFAFELVLVDDGSSDRSYELIEQFAAQYPDIITVVKLTRNFGQTAAIQAGLWRCRGDCVGIISADLQEPPEKFLEMLARWQKGEKFIVGRRSNREEGWLHRTTSNTYWRLVQRYALRGYPKEGYDFCILDREIVQGVNSISEKNSSIFLLIYWLGYNPSFVEVSRRKRDLGHSQWSFAKKIGTSIDILIGFTYVPSRLITTLGLVASALAMGFLIFLLFAWQTTGNAPPGWMTSVGLQLLVGSLIFFSLGIVSEYLVRILDETRKRPPFVIDERKPAGEESSAAEEKKAGDSVQPS